MDVSAFGRFSFFPFLLACTFFFPVRYILSMASGHVFDVWDEKKKGEKGKNVL